MELVTAAESFLSLCAAKQKKKSANPLVCQLLYRMTGAKFITVATETATALNAAILDVRTFPMRKAEQLTHVRLKHLLEHCLTTFRLSVLLCAAAFSGITPYVELCMVAPKKQRGCDCGESCLLRAWEDMTPIERTVFAKETLFAQIEKYKEFTLSITWRCTQAGEGGNKRILALTKKLCQWATLMLKPVLLLPSIRMRLTKVDPKEEPNPYPAVVYPTRHELSSLLQEAEDQKEILLASECESETKVWIRLLQTKLHVLCDAARDLYYW